MRWMELLTKWWGRSEWQQRVAHVAQACTNQIVQQLSGAQNWMTPAERYGYLRAKATPVIAACVTLHTQGWTDHQKERFFRDVQEQVVWLLERELLRARPHSVREAA